MEGPSLLIAEENLKYFKNKQVKSVTGNTKVGKERLVDKSVLDIFSWGKHLVFQFDEFAMRIHFMLYGTFTSEINGEQITGEYTKTGRLIRLELIFDGGNIRLYNCSIKFIEEKNAKEAYDFSKNIMSSKWNSSNALASVLSNPNEEIADVLLDQEIFAGVGNIIKNEVLSITLTNPKTNVKDLSNKKIKEIIKVAYDFSRDFYKWRKKFVLKKHLIIYRKSICPHCGGKVIREKIGKRYRWSFYCPLCQPL